MKTLFVSNINFKTRTEELSELFSVYGAIGEIVIPKDKRTGKTKGYAFVEIEDEAAAAAIAATNETDFGGRKIVVELAKKSTDA